MPQRLAEPGTAPATKSTRSFMRMWWALLFLCALVQIVSALWLVDDYESPNASTQIALTLAQTGEFSSDLGWRLRGGFYQEGDPPLKMFHQPGEVLYMAAGFSLLPPGLWPLLHVPVVLLLVGSLMYCTLVLLGHRAALIVGLLTTVHPFIVIHGPVWDDTFFAAALCWLVMALLLRIDRHPGNVAASAGFALVLFVAAGFAAITRPQSMFVLGALVVAGFALASQKHLRGPLAAILLGMSVSVGAWALRNHEISGEWLLGSSRDGIALWESNYPHAIESMYTGQVSYLNARYMQDDYTATQAMTEWEADAYFKQRAIAHMLDHPWPTLNAGLLKLAVTFSGAAPELPLSDMRNSVALILNALALVAVLIALCRADWGSWPPAKIIFTVFMVSALSCTVILSIIGPVGWRYRIELEGFVMMAAAFCFCNVLPAWRRALARSQTTAGAST